MQRRSIKEENPVKQNSTCLVDIDSIVPHVRNENSDLEIQFLPGLLVNELKKIQDRDDTVGLESVIVTLARTILNKDMQTLTTLWTIYTSRFYHSK